ncbi:hypothetical protein ETW23_06095 [Leisingera sp. NJS201]|uniref:hypothetical protein n=1 Tax=Leisingera sp. NJS201 TaxID=2508306 RepID=UPI0010712F67|nr:hypothetical protein [Leisingera sp. NJS201]QBR35780.1 hypothetical protein ETW23_06095 [Leisingera sp. NJS201]
MGGIPHPEREFAVIQRLCSQMPFDDSEFKATECYAAFNTILCWTLQRIRSGADPVTPLQETLRTRDITEFCDLTAHSYDDGNLGAEDEAHGASLDDLSNLTTQDGQPLGVLEVLISLRDSVAHPEDLRVYPVNRRGFLIGFRFECRKPRGQSAERWENGSQYRLYLTRHGMTKIAQALGEAYCAAFTQVGAGVQDAATEMGEE